MSGSTNRLTNIEIKAAKKAGKLADGGGLFLQVSASGSRSWVFRYRWEGKRPEIGLGGFPSVTLAKARETAAKLRSGLTGAVKVDPRDILLAEYAAANTPNVELFGDFAERVVPSITESLTNQKARAQWLSTLRTYARPIWSKPLNEIERRDILKCISPIWHEKQETARRTLGRIESVLNMAMLEGLRDGANPAVWRGNMALAFARSKQKPKHHQSLPYEDLPDVWRKIKERDSMSARTLALTILTCGRASEVREARWSEIDFDAALWIVPAPRMKERKEHRVPLSRQALELLHELREIERGPFLFWGQGKGSISETAVRKTLASVAPSGTTTHGFRSTFKVWATEATQFPDELSELCLAHAVGDATRRAYARSDGLERRVRIMQAWADYATRAAASNVVNLRA